MQSAKLDLHKDEVKETRSWLARLGLEKPPSAQQSSKPAPYAPAPLPPRQAKQPEEEILDWSRPSSSPLDILKKPLQKQKFVQAVQRPSQPSPVYTAKPEPEPKQASSAKPAPASSPVYTAKPVQGEKPASIMDTSGSWSADLEAGRASTEPHVVLPELAERASKTKPVSLIGISPSAVSAQPMTAYPPGAPVDPAEWDRAYAKELSRPTPSPADSEEYYAAATWEQKKFLYALWAESAYWRMRGGAPGSAAQARDEKEFLSILETASPEQRLAIELCINLTKAMQALMLSTSSETEGISSARARAVYQQIVAERADIRPILYYRLSRMALARSCKKGSPNPSADYLAFIAKLDEPSLMAVFAMRAAFFDHLMNDAESSAALRAAAAEHYSRLLLGRPGIEQYLQQYLKVREGIDLYLSKPNASVLEDPRTNPHGWLHMLNEDEVTRSILNYELATIFFRSEHKVLLQSPQPDEPTEGPIPPSIAPSPGPLEPKVQGRPASSQSRGARIEPQKRPLSAGAAANNPAGTHHNSSHHSSHSRSSSSRAPHGRGKRH